MNLSEVLLRSFCNFTNLHLSINTIVIKLSFSYGSGKILGKGARVSKVKLT